MPKIVVLFAAAAVVAVGALLLAGGSPRATHAVESDAPASGQSPVIASVAVAAPANKIYWSDGGLFQVGQAGVMRANLDGSSVEALITGRTQLSDIHVDPAGGKIYWSEQSGPHRSDLSGGSIEQLQAVASASIWADIKNGKVYWASPLQSKIQRANLNGTFAEDDYALFFPIAAGVTVDPINSRLYWVSVGDNHGNATDGKVLRSEHLGPPGGPGPRLNRGVEPDGNYEIIVPSASSTPITDLGDVTGIALDLSAGKVYWVDILRGNIQRANLDGSGPEDLVTGLTTFPYGIALDPLNGHMYWTNRGDKTITRANLDGSSPTDILTSLNDPWFLTLDIDRCPALSSSTPLDNDADWRCEDTNANGRQDFQDVVALFVDLQLASVQNNPTYFDYNSNNGVDFADVVTLFEELAAQVGVLP